MSARGLEAYRRQRDLIVVQQLERDAAARNHHERTELWVTHSTERDLEWPSAIGATTALSPTAPPELANTSAGQNHGR